MEPILNIIAANIRYYRKKAGISQEKLGELAGLHRTYIGGVERGDRPGAAGVGGPKRRVSAEPHHTPDRPECRAGPDGEGASHWRHARR